MHALGVTRRRQKQEDSTLFGYDAPPETPTLTRDVFKWVHSLDMSHSIRNIRRDLSNGFLVAEIFSRYFPADVQMHSFENGNSLRYKKDNWEQLQRFCARQHIDWPTELVQGTMDRLHGAAVALLEHLYEVFTGKKVERMITVQPEALELRVGQRQAGGRAKSGEDADAKGFPAGMKLISSQAPAGPLLEFGTVQTKVVSDVGALRRKLAGQL